jgi:hypothetical protein
MRVILTKFDYTKYPYLPLRTFIYDKDRYLEVPLYERGTGFTINKIEDNISKISKLINNCYINRFKSYIDRFKIQSVNNVYDLPLDVEPTREICEKLSKVKPLIWQKLSAEASLIYQLLEDRGLYFFDNMMHPRYSFSTYTGRSKSQLFNIQGTMDGDDVKHINNSYNYYIHLDWVAADIRMASYFSQDKNLELSFKESDPYTFVSKYLNSPDISRDDIKNHFLKSFYSLDFDNPVFDIYQGFRSYMKDKVKELDTKGYSKSILGRVFPLKKDKLSTFNAQFQGSVAHAMNAAVVKIAEEFSDFLITEVHDSVILCCNKDNVKHVINGVSKIMVDPLNGYMNDSPRMPTKVSIGKKWREWKLVKVYR